jgi:hypothetical protein
MTSIRFENPATPEAFLAEMEKRNIVFPLVPSSLDGGTILDDAGEEVLTIDPAGMMPDDDVTALTAYFCMALNNAAGFRAIAATASFDIEEGGAA